MNRESMLIEADELLTPCFCTNGAQFYPFDANREGFYSLSEMIERFNQEKSPWIRNFIRLRDGKNWLYIVGGIPQAQYTVYKIQTILKCRLGKQAFRLTQMNPIILS